MTKKSRTTQQQRARQEQWRRRVDAQVGGSSTRTADAPTTASNTAIEDEATDEAAGYTQAELRRMPAGVSTGGAATRAMNRAGGSPTVSTAGQRRAIAASRATRARMAVNAMSLEEEMHYVRADIRKLTILTVACLSIIIVLAFVINML
jgi:hypothetical protein